MVRNALIRSALLLVVLAHFALFLALAGSGIALLIWEPWYVSIPLVTWILRLPVLPGVCQLTQLESSLRVRLGLSPIKSFIREHVLKTYVKIKKRIKRG